jgi:hypothetical protein
MLLTASLLCLSVTELTTAHCDGFLKSLLSPAYNPCLLPKIQLKA